MIILRHILSGLGLSIRFAPRRRSLLRGAGYGFLGGILSAFAPGNDAAVEAEDTLQDENDWLYAVADAIVPRDDDPGAVDAKVPERMRALLQRDPRRRRLYRQGYALLNAASRSFGAESFARLDVNRRIQLLEALWQREDGRPFVMRARTDVLFLFYASEVGQRVVDYRPPQRGYLDGPGTPPADGSRP